MRTSRIFAVALLCGAGAASASTTIFTDDFNANATALNAAPAGWSVSTGTVDIIGPGLFDFIPGSGRYIDLDGSTFDAGLLEKSFVLLAGTPYTATFELAGNQRNTDSETVTVNFGSATTGISLPMGTGWTGYTLGFTTGAAGSYTLSFQNSGGDNIGMLLDNVTVTQVPEPSAYLMLSAGLMLIGFAARRRTR